MVFECLIGHAFDHVRGLCEKFIPSPIRVNLSEQHGANRFLLLFRKFLRYCVGLIKEVGHGAHSNPSPWPEPERRGASARSSPPSAARPFRGFRWLGRG